MEEKEPTRLDRICEQINSINSLISITNAAIINHKPSENLTSLIRSERVLLRKHREAVIELHSIQNSILDKGRGSVFGYSIAQKNTNQYSN